MEQKKIFEEIMAEIFPNLAGYNVFKKLIEPQIGQPQRNPWQDTL